MDTGNIRAHASYKILVTEQLLSPLFLRICKTKELLANLFSVVLELSGFVLHSMNILHEFLVPVTQLLKSGAQSGRKAGWRFWKKTTRVVDTSNKCFYPCGQAHCDDVFQACGHPGYSPVLLQFGFSVRETIELPHLDHPVAKFNESSIASKPSPLYLGSTYR